MHISWRIDNITKEAKSANNGAGEVEYSSPDGEKGSEHNAVGFEELSDMCVPMETIVCDTEPFEDYAI